MRKNNYNCHTDKMMDFAKSVVILIIVAEMIGSWVEKNNTSEKKAIVDECIKLAESRGVEITTDDLDEIIKMLTERVDDSEVKCEESADE